MKKILLALTFILLPSLLISQYSKRAHSGLDSKAFESSYTMFEKSHKANEFTAKNNRFSKYRGQKLKGSMNSSIAAKINWRQNSNQQNSTFLLIGGLFIALFFVLSNSVKASTGILRSYWKYPKEQRFNIENSDQEQRPVIKTPADKKDNRNDRPRPSL
jgi:hypothetical protein